MQIDYSQLSTFINCPQKYYLKYVLCLQKRAIDLRDVDKLFGQCTHTGLERYYKRESNDKVIASFDEFKDVPDEQHKTKQNGVDLLTEYIQHYESQDKDMQVLDTEIVGKFKIGDIDYLVKLDTIVKLNDNIYSLEHKTTKNIAYNYFDRFNLSMQLSGQSEFIRQKHGQCSGILLNVLQSGYRKRAYKGESAGFHCKFQREIINRTPEQLDDFKDNVSLWCRKLNYALSDKSWGKNESACHAFRGCQYKELCLTSKGISLDEQIKDTFYDKIDPYAYLKK
tara:strand:+ start:8652 stop:9494 length:843 start_codon:yes stop_codon:yes gene_type:complete